MKAIRVSVDEREWWKVCGFAARYEKAEDMFVYVVDRQTFIAATKDEKAQVRFMADVTEAFEEEISIASYR